MKKIKNADFQRYTGFSVNEKPLKKIFENSLSKDSPSNLFIIDFYSFKDLLSITPSEYSFISKNSKRILIANEYFALTRSSVHESNKSTFHISLQNTLFPMCKCEKNLFSQWDNIIHDIKFILFVSSYSNFIEPYNHLSIIKNFILYTPPRNRLAEIEHSIKNPYANNPMICKNEY